MKIKDLGEFGLIDRLVSVLSIKNNSVVIGFGDDCSAVEIENQLYLFTGDIQLEGKHFIKDRMPPEDLGWKLVSINVSDVVACGGLPKWGFISVGFPPDTNFDYVEKIYRGINEALDFYKADIIGGNTTSSDQVLLDLFLVGKTERFVSRSGAIEGDFLLLSGFTGLSRAGLELLMMKKSRYEEFEKRLIKAFTKPVARIDLSEKIQKFANSCIDISDGLAGDLGHLQKSSKVKIVIDKSSLPVHSDLTAYCKKYEKDPYEYILYGGEDYQLAFTVSKENLEHFNDCFVIGKVEKGEGIFLIENKKTIKIKEKGFEHI
ncbi:thiamine-phosphate kinase [Persephonella sp.]|uniref:thiamine-phosphate kinase n=1 Tax=Persephonella sp. TaxID=2060922 RepID=UPI00261B05AD|nr:thiamine-phosphate kinase [Persephonella sp.]